MSALSQEELDKLKEKKDEEYVFKATSKKAEDFIKSLAGTDRKLSKLLYMKLTPGEKIKYKMLLTKSHKKYLANMKTNEEIKNESKSN